MKPIFTYCFIGITALALSQGAQANIIVALEPAAQSSAVGSSVSIDLIISGLGDHASPSLGGFDFLLNYDPAVLSATSVSFGNQLDLGNAGAVQGFNLGVPGVIQLDQISLESVSDLQTSQPSSFTLATLGLTAVGPGTSAIDFSFGSLSDETGEISLEFSTQSAQVQVTGLATVGESGSAAPLFALGLLGLFAFRPAPVYSRGLLQA